MIPTCFVKPAGFRLLEESGRSAIELPEGWELVRQDYYHGFPLVDQYGWERARVEMLVDHETITHILPNNFFRIPVGESYVLKGWGCCPRCPWVAEFSTSALAYKWLKENYPGFDDCMAYWHDPVAGGGVHLCRS